MKIIAPGTGAPGRSGRHDRSTGIRDRSPVLGGAYDSEGRFLAQAVIEGPAERVRHRGARMQPYEYGIGGEEGHVEDEDAAVGVRRQGAGRWVGLGGVVAARSRPPRYRRR